MSETITVSLPPGHDPELVGDFMMQMAYCDPAVLDYSLTTTEPRDLLVKISAEASAADVERKVRLLASRMLGTNRRPAVLVKEHVHDAGRNAVDVEPGLAERGWVRRAGSGLFHLAGPAAALFEYFDARFSSMAAEAAAVTEYYPPFIGVQALHRLGFFESTPQYATFVNHLNEDIDQIDRFMAEVGSSGTVAGSRGSLAGPDQVLASTVCCHTFAGRAHSTVSAPIAVTARNNCTRYESRNLAHLDRLWSFNMREIIFLAEDGEFAERGRDTMLQRTEALLDELQLSYRIERANDLFFTPDFSKRVTFQRGLGLKLEVRLLVPPKNSTVACASFNLHHTNFGRRMEILGSGGTPVHSSCVGFGIERWVYCFLQQYGLDAARWPETVSDVVRE